MAARMLTTYNSLSDDEKVEMLTIWKAAWVPSVEQVRGMTPSQRDGLVGFFASVWKPTADDLEEALGRDGGDGTLGELELTEPSGRFVSSALRKMFPGDKFRLLFAEHDNRSLREQRDAAKESEDLWKRKCCAVVEEAKKNNVSRKRLRLSLGSTGENPIQVPSDISLSGDSDDDA